MSLAISVIELKIAVFAKGTRTNGIASYSTDVESATYMVSVLRIAKWVNNRYKSVIMLVEPSNAKLRDTSCSMGPEVSFLAASGSKHHIALVEAYRPWFRFIDQAA
jgi:hypothetical protein